MDDEEIPAGVSIFIPISSDMQKQEPDVFPVLHNSIAPFISTLAEPSFSDLVQRARFSMSE